VQDRELARARQKLHDAHRLLETSEQDPEAAKDAYQKVLEARSMLSGIRTTYLAAIRQAELDRAVEVFNKVAREDAKPSEESAFDNMIRTAERLISNSSGEFDNVLDEMQSCTWSIVWRDDGFVTHTFERFAQQPYLFPDQDAYRFLVQKGGDELARSAIEELRQTVLEMYRIKASTSWSDEINLSNIM
jgi:molecular chaperone DnaK